MAHKNNASRYFILSLLAFALALGTTLTKFAMMAAIVIGTMLLFVAAVSKLHTWKRQAKIDERSWNTDIISAKIRKGQKLKGICTFIERQLAREKPNEKLIVDSFAEGFRLADEIRMEDNPMPSEMYESAPMLATNAIKWCSSAVSRFDELVRQRTMVPIAA